MGIHVSRLDGQQGAVALDGVVQRSLSHLNLRHHGIGVDQARVEHQGPLEAGQGLFQSPLIAQGGA